MRLQIVSTICPAQSLLALSLPLPTQAAELLSTPTAPGACVFKQCNIANFDRNYRLSDSEIKEAKEEDTSTELFD